MHRFIPGLNEEYLLQEHTCEHTDHVESYLRSRGAIGAYKSILVNTLTMLRHTYRVEEHFLLQEHTCEHTDHVEAYLRSRGAIGAPRAYL